MKIKKGLFSIEIDITTDELQDLLRSFPEKFPLLTFILRLISKITK